MTAREKAEELVNKYWNLPTTFTYVIDGVVFVDDSHINYKTAKQCALIVVDELIKETDWNETGYWQKVKQEIINL